MLSWRTLWQPVYVCPLTLRAHACRVVYSESNYITVSYFVINNWCVKWQNGVYCRWLLILKVSRLSPVDVYCMCSKSNYLQITSVLSSSFGIRLCNRDCNIIDWLTEGLRHLGIAMSCIILTQEGMSLKPLKH